MSDQFIGEIRLVPFNFAPVGWALCNGAVLSIAQNTALFSLLGTQFGGDGIRTFALPNLQGQVPMDWGSGAGLTPRVIGESGGSPTVTLLQSEIPSHSHSLNGNAITGTTGSPAGMLVSEPPGSARKAGDLYSTSPANTPLLAGSVLPIGGNQPHNNLQPYLTLNFIIALTGVFPARS